jgi:hypothetical protein
MATYATLDQLKAYLRITGTAFDSTLNIMLDAAELAINSETDRPFGFAYGTKTELLDGCGGATLQLRYKPVDTTAAFTVSIDGETVNATEYSVDGERGTIGFKNPAWMLGYPGTNIAYGLLGNTGLRMLQPTFGDGFRQVSVFYYGGYVTIPATLTLATIQWAASLWYERNIGPYKSENLGSYSYTLADVLASRNAAQVALAQAGLTSGKVFG